uniref:SH3 and SYLF domain containing 1 n=1 Tax=Cyprinus carpio TaxID=7962 RepID=A0A8C1WFE8_CYPCA
MVTDIFVIIWNQRRSVDAFSKGGNLTFGGNFTVAIGPLGRDLEADVAFHSTAAVYSYSKSRGLYAGVSLGGSYLIEQRYKLKVSTLQFYGQDIHASAIFNGDVEPPPKAYDLYTILQDYTEKYTTDWQNKHMQASSKVTVYVLLPHVGQTYIKPSNFYSELCSNIQ